MMKTKIATELDDAGWEALLAEVKAAPPEQDAVPPDRDLLAMMDCIIEAAHVPVDSTPDQLGIRLGIVQGTAERLIPLLERQAAPLWETVDRIASTPREGEPFDDQMTGSDHQERCERSPAAAYQALDSLILIARAAIAEAQEAQR